MEKPWTSRVPSWIQCAARDALARSGCVEPLTVFELLPIALGVASQWNVERTAVLVLLFSGEGASAKHAQDTFGVDTRTIERTDEPCQCVLTLCGLLYAIYCVYEIVPKGTMWASPECRTWLMWLSRGTYKRSADNCFLGDEELGPVQEANSCAVILSVPQCASSDRC
eukprot:3633018-Pyramimonas_sp.AAC.1